MPSVFSRRRRRCLRHLAGSMAMCSRDQNLLLVLQQVDRSIDVGEMKVK